MDTKTVVQEKSPLEAKRFQLSLLEGRLSVLESIHNERYQNGLRQVVALENARLMMEIPMGPIEGGSWTDHHNSQNDRLDLQKRIAKLREEIAVLEVAH